MSEEPVLYGTRRSMGEQPASLAVLARSLVTANYGDLVDGYGALSTESEVRLAHQIGRLIQLGLELEGRA